jgi:phosphate transport system permease protein
MKQTKEKLYRALFTVVGFSSLFILLGIVVVLFREGIPVFAAASVPGFILGRSWYPTAAPPEFGILPLILGSVWVTAGAMALAVPLGIGSALFINELAGRRLRLVLKPAIEVLAAVPSIVFGFFGIVVVAPFVQHLFRLPTGLCALSAGIVLGIMAIPTIASIAEDALSVVPGSFREASLALGATRWQTLTRIVVPAAGSGFSTAVILGLSRVVGETMTVLMVSGGAAVIPNSLFEPVRPMTATIAAEMGEAATGSPHYHALFAIGLVLFCITLVINVIAELAGRKYRIKLGLER